MNSYSTIEVSLKKHVADSYTLDMRFCHPGDAADTRPLTGQKTVVQIDRNYLRQVQLDPEEYGKRLGEFLLKSPEAKTSYQMSRQMARAREVPLRFSLALDPTAPELHNIRWEMIRLLDEDLPLAMQEQVLFSRYFSSAAWDLVTTKPRSDMQTLVMIAAPYDATEFSLGGQQLAPINVSDELERVRQGFRDVSFEAIVAPEQATLSNLISRLRGGFDILYLVCHGALLKGRSILYLTDGKGLTRPTEGKELVWALRELTQLPQLVMLISCQSAGAAGEPKSDDEGALAALGPQLAAAGIPAVLAMQGNITMATIARFMPAFFQELQRDGQIDRAVAVARRTVAKRTDAWTPTLFLRLRSGRLWMTPSTIKPTVATYREERFLDAALPEKVKVGEETELVTMIRLPDSGGLRRLLEERDEFSSSAEDVRSEEFLLKFPLDDQGKPTALEVLLEIETNDFIVSKAWQNIKVRPNEDTKQVVFLLTSKRQGELRLLINVYVYDCLVAAGLMKVTGQTLIDEGYQIVRRLLTLRLGGFGTREDPDSLETKEESGEEAQTKDITYIEGIGDVYADKLREVGIDSQQGLLEKGATRKGRSELADQTGLSDRLIRSWVNQADLYRVKGVGVEYADLLEAAGVDTVPELARRNPQNLLDMMISINEEKHLLRHLPSLSMVEEWIAQANNLSRIITY